jgi:hypothetical protein
MCLVQTNMFNTDKVLAGRQRLLDRPLDTIFLPGAPGAVIARRAGADGCFVDFDLEGISICEKVEEVKKITYPVARPIIIRYLPWCLADIHEPRSGMLNELIVEQLEPDLVARLDGIGRGAAGLGALVAAKVVGVHEFAGDGWVVGVAVLPRVGILASD